MVLLDALADKPLGILRHGHDTLEKRLAPGLALPGNLGANQLAAGQLVCRAGLPQPVGQYRHHPLQFGALPGAEKREHPARLVQRLLQARDRVFFGLGISPYAGNVTQLLIEQGDAKRGEKIPFRLMQAPAQGAQGRVLQYAGNHTGCKRLHRSEQLDAMFQGVTQHNQAIGHLPGHQHHARQLEALPRIVMATVNIHQPGFQRGFHGPSGPVLPVGERRHHRQRHRLLGRQRGRTALSQGGAFQGSLQHPPQPLQGRQRTVRAVTPEFGQRLLVGPDQQRRMVVDNGLQLGHAHDQRMGGQPVGVDRQAMHALDQGNRRRVDKTADHRIHRVPKTITPGRAGAIGAFHGFGNGQLSKVHAQGRILLQQGLFEAERRNILKGRAPGKIGGRKIAQNRVTNQ